jgi:transcriptional regulator with XRE-family HTH domain
LIDIVADTIGRQFAGLCRATRMALDVTQDAVARATGISRPRISAIERGAASPTLNQVEAIARALGLQLELVSRPPIVMGTRQRDLAHARCSGYIQRRLEAAGFICLREVEVIGGRSHGWIDLLAFNRRTGCLLVIEIKTVLDDIGHAERQLAWYSRVARKVVADHGWHPRTVKGWLLVLATDDVDKVIVGNRDVLDLGFPTRAVAMRRELTVGGSTAEGWGLALIDPSSRRRTWLQATRLEGRRTVARYRNYADAAARWRAPRPATVRAPAGHALENQGRSLGNHRSDE